MYSIDASAFIDGWVRYYPPDVIPSIWNNLEGLVNTGTLRSTEEVKFELERGADALYDWCCTRAGLFRTSSTEI
jgi:hypothetical protein